MAKSNGKPKAGNGIDPAQKAKEAAAFNADFNNKLPRQVLPIADIKPKSLTTYSATDADTKFPPIVPLRPPTGAPNIIVFLIDDAGFGLSSAFGGPCQTPNAEKLASKGLKYTRFHTTALCSPSRAALLSGRNHHAVGMGGITEIATSAPGYNSIRPNTCGPLAEILRLNGYSTAQFGKCHEVPVFEATPVGPYDRWPTGSGFERFYGFIGGETNQYSPPLYDGTTPVQPEKTAEEGYHLTEDLADKAIAYIRQQKAIAPDKPFFVYFAPGATHAPHHVPKEWIARYKGKFDQGWDKLREETLARQKQFGVVPADTKLAPKPEAIKDWAKLTDNERKLFARQMEVFAGFGEYADFEVGRLIQAVEDLGQLDNTLVFYIVGDNGASAEGTMNGLFNEMTYFNGVPESVEDVLKHLDELGGPNSYGHYAAGWAVAGDTPFTWTKQIAGSYGGCRNGMVVHWPKKITAKGELRTQWHHVIDIAPTILESAGLPEPKEVNGSPQIPIQGVSLLYSFADAKAASPHKTQYFEIFGNRGIYHDGWLAHTVHKAAWETKARHPFLEDKWELYHVETDFSSREDLAAKNPDKLKELQELFLSEAVKNHVLPLDDRGVERVNAALAGRPDLMQGRTSLTLYEGMVGMSESVFMNVKNRSFSITADVEVPKGGANG